jgi:Predicted permease.
MYIKLALCNVKRSIFDYMLYIITMIVLISVLCVSNFIAIYGNIRAGFQTVALPFLIVLIMIVLVNYINLFMIKQRAGEFATYLLLGMEKDKLTYMFLLEFCFIGSLCFILGEMIGTVVYIAIFRWFLGSVIVI